MLVVTVLIDEVVGGPTWRMFNSEAVSLPGIAVLIDFMTRNLAGTVILVSGDITVALMVPSTSTGTLELKA